MHKKKLGSHLVRRGMEGERGGRLQDFSTLRPYDSKTMRKRKVRSLEDAGEATCVSLTSTDLFLPSYSSSSSDNRRVRAGLQRSKG